MKRSLLICSVLLCSATSALATAPTVSTPGFTNLGANQVTLSLRSDANGTGYFVLLPGANTTPGTGAQTKAGQDSSGAVAYRMGSLPLVANTDGTCTVRDLQASTAYTVCFTADDGTTLQSTSTAASFTTLVTTDLTGMEWSAVGTAGFSAGGITTPHLELSPDGTPWIAFREGSVNSYKSTVMKYQGGAWSAVGGVGFTAGRGDDPCLTFAPDGTPYVAFSDFSANGATVMKYTGGNWTAVGSAGFSSGSVGRISLAFAPDGLPWVVYQDKNQSGYGTVMRFTGSSWTIVGTAGAAPSPVTTRAIGFTFDGTPLVAGDNNSDSKAMLVKFNGTAWEDLTSGGLSSGVANAVRLALSPSGEPHVGYCDGGQSSKVVVKKLTGTTWSQIGDTGAGTASAGMLSLAVGADASVYISFKANTYSNTTVMRYRAAAWSTVGRSRISAGVADHTSLVLAPDGTPYVAFGDYANGNSDGLRATVMKMTPPPPTLTTPTFSNLGANQVTLTLQSNATGRGYFTLLPGAHATAGTGTQTKAGLDSTGAAAFRSGSLPLTANSAATYTVRNLTAGTDYTVCFTADNGSGVQSTSATAPFTTTAATDLTGGVWVAALPTRFTPGGASELTLAMTAQGAPSVAFRDSGPDRLSGGQATMMTFNGTAWAYVGSAGFSRSIPNDCTLVLSPTGRPYVAYADYSDPPVNCNYATVMTFDGTTWSPVGSPRFTPGQAGDVSLAISPSGTPWVAFNEPDNNFKLAVMSFDGTTWGGAGSSLSDGTAGDVKIAFAPNGVPYVAFRDGARSSRASVLKLEGGTWSYVGSAGFAGGTGGAYFLSLAFAPNGTPYLAFSDFSNAAKACVVRFDGTSWVNVGAPDFSPTEAKYLSLAFAPDGQPWIGFRDQIWGNFVASVMAFDGTSWAVRGSRGISAGGGTDTPLAFAPDGTPYVGFSDSPDGKASVMRLQIPVPPTVTSVDAPAPGGYATDDYLVFTIQFSTAVTVEPMPVIRLTIGSNTRYAGYYSGSGTSSLVFRYKVQSSDSGTVTVYNAPINLLSGSIKSSLEYSDAILTLNNVGSTAGITLGSLPAPTLTTPTTTNLGANQVTLQLRSSATGTGYFTLLPGAGATPGTGAQVKAGRDSSAAAAFRFGSLPLTANTTASYTIRNLVAGTAYTVCFTADDGTTLQSTPVTASFTTSAAVDFAALNWAQAGTVLSTDAADYDVLVFAPDGTPYVAFQDYSLAHKITVKRFDGTNWVTVGAAGFSDGTADFISLAISPDGTPYVAYKDDAHSYKATAMRFTSGAWSAVGSVGFSAGQAADNSLGFAPDSTVHLAFRDVANSQKATVMKFTGSTWTVVGSAGVSPNIAYNVSLAFSPTGQPHIAYRDESRGGKVSVMNFDGTTWANVGPAGFSDDTAYPSPLMFAPDGTPYIAFQDAAHALKATVMKFTSGAWTNVGSAGFTVASASNPSLAFAAAGTPYVAFMDAGTASKATVMRFDGTGWVNVGATGFSSGSSGFPCLAFAPNGRPWVAYKDNGNSGKATVMSLSAATATVSLSGLTATYDGSAHPATVTTSPTGLSTSVTYEGGVTVPTNAGSYAVVATVTSSNYTGSASGTLVINKADQTITFAALSGRTVGDPAFTLAATSTSGLPVSYGSSNPGVAAVSGSTVTIVGAGSTNITASQGGNANTNAAPDVARTLTVSSAVPPPVVTISLPLIIYSPSSQSITEGDNVTLTVTALGSGLTYQWRKDGTDISGAQSSMLTLSNVGTGAAGDYTVVVRNGAGAVTSSPAVLSVAARIVAPTIRTQPRSQFARYGQTIALTVGVSGTAPFTYQWYKDNVAIAGATLATLTLSPALPASAGIYAVTVANSAGNARSSSAALTVGPRGLLGAYLGTFAGGTAGPRGTFALYLRDDGTGVFLAYEASGQLAFVVRTVQLDPNRHFRSTITPANAAASTTTAGRAALAAGPTTVDVTIAANGSISGTFTGSMLATLTAGEPPVVGTPADVAGFYEAGVAGSSASSYYIVNDARTAYVLTVNGNQADVATGTISASGAFTLTSDNHASINGVIDCSTATLTSTITGASGGSATHSGGNSAVRTEVEKMINVSGRGLVSSSDPLIAGFVITGTEPKRVLVRGVGPSLTAFGVANALSAARLEVFRAAKSIAVGTDWSVAGNAAELAATAASVGAFPLVTNSRDATLLLTLEPGSYSAVVTGQGAATGLALAEVFDASERTAARTERIINISSRAHVGAGDAAVFSGFVVNGSVPKRVLIRGVGPSLAQFGISNPLSRPELTLWSGRTVVARNAGWSISPDAAAIAAAGVETNTFPLLSGGADTALILYLQPGGYCVQISGRDATTGVALAEVYELP